MLDLYIAAHSDAPSLMLSSDLTAAMTLWVADLVNKPEAGLWFEFAATPVKVLSDRDLLAIIRDEPFAPIDETTGHRSAAWHERTARGYAVVPIQLDL